MVFMGFFLCTCMLDIVLDDTLFLYIKIYSNSLPVSEQPSMARRVFWAANKLFGMTTDSRNRKLVSSCKHSSRSSNHFTYKTNPKQTLLF